MKELDKETAIIMLEKKLINFDIPVHRKKVNANNIKWLVSNFLVKNSSKKDFQETYDLIKKIESNKWWKN